MNFCQRNRLFVAALISLSVVVPTLSAASRTSPRKPATSHIKSTKSSAKSSGKSVSASTRKHGAVARNGKLAKSGKRSNAPAIKRSHGQQGIDSDRAREIQSALIREHYLDGEPSGVWDSQTRAAMVRLQGDNGWQTKVTPDSRALIKLGLGPNHEGLLNPDSAAVATPMSRLRMERDVSSGSMQR